ncbi:hypothetical protein [Flavobacterium stagni]|uniref:Hydrolase n=1 Tax=Flavobacterium stagni TaxID=2506421 RepID=A0A4Q1KAS3_9FLAO|nr:hypothetical protein [Flavobacterium stagni]RXR23385.1 hypothetical protein EQG61_05295 [Flavobacterium stagni]
MARQLYLYLFIITALLASFTYVYYSKQLKFEKDSKTQMLKSKSDSIVQLTNQLDESNAFSLLKNEYAQNYFVNFDVKQLEPSIREQLIAFNDSPAGNVYTGQEKLGEQKFIINKMKVLNHRWIIANYSDGTYWGEAMIKYFVDDKGKATFQTMDTFIYPKEEY